MINKERMCIYINWTGSKFSPKLTEFLIDFEWEKEKLSIWKPKIYKSCFIYFLKIICFLTHIFLYLVVF